MDKEDRTSFQVSRLQILLSELAESLCRQGKVETAEFLRKHKASLQANEKDLRPIAEDLEYLSRSAPMSQYAGLTEEQNHLFFDILRISASLSDSMK